MRALSELRPSTRKTYNFIVSFIRDRGYSPSTREIRDGVPLSSTSVSVYHRDQLVRRGLLTHDPNRTRGIGIAGSLTLTFYGEDAHFIREQFGESPGCELAIINWLRQPVGDVQAFMS